MSEKISQWMDYLWSGESNERDDIYPIMIQSSLSYFSFTPITRNCGFILFSGINREKDLCLIYPFWEMQNEKIQIEDLEILEGYLNPYKSEISKNITVLIPRRNLLGFEDTNIYKSDNMNFKLEIYELGIERLLRMYAGNRKVIDEIINIESGAAVKNSLPANEESRRIIA